MNAEEPGRRYSGVTRHAGKWLVKLRHRGRDVTIGHYEDPEEAAYAGDFARYMLLGLRPTSWHANAARPNFPPSHSYPRAPILSRLVSAQAIPVDVLRSRLVEYLAAADQRASTAGGLEAGGHGPVEIRVGGTKNAPEGRRYA